MTHYTKTEKQKILRDYQAAKARVEKTKQNNKKASGTLCCLAFLLRWL